MKDSYGTYDGRKHEQPYNESSAVEHAPQEIAGNERAQPAIDLGSATQRAVGPEAIDALTDDGGETPS